MRENSAIIDAEVKSVWLGLEELRCKALEQEELNRKLKTLLKLLNEIDGDIAIFQPFMESKIFLDKNFNELSNSLEHSRHHLQVIGEHVNLDSSTVKKLQKDLHPSVVRCTERWSHKIYGNEGSDRHSCPDCEGKRVMSAANETFVEKHQV